MVYASALPFHETGLATQEPRAELSEIFRFFRRRWAYILGTALIVALIAALVVLQATPRYSATATVAVQTQKGQLVDVQDVVSNLAPDTATMETQVSILRATRLAEQVVDRLKLDRDPEFNSALRKSGGFVLWNPKSWFGQEKPKVPEGKLSPLKAAERRTAIVSAVAKAFAIEAVPRSYVLSITATSSDPQKATAMANALADLYIQDGIDAKYEATRRASAYLQDRVDELRAQAVQSDRAAELYRSQSGLVGAVDGSTIDTQQLSELNSQLIVARSERAAKEAQLAQLRALSSGGGENGVETSGAILESPLIQRLREQESEVLRKLAELQATYGERHPRIINANAELRDLRSKIQDEVRKVAASAANDVAIARARESTLASSLGSIEGRVSRGGQASVRLRELQREADSNKSVYELFLNRLKETRQQVDVQTADSRIVSSAIVPLNATYPRVTSTIGAAAMAGLVIGILLSLALEKLDNTVRGAEALEGLGGGATLAFVPVVTGGYERPEEVVTARPQAMAAESLRTLRSALALSDVDNPPKLVMLSSSVPAEGKTFVSVGLARVSAQSGARTLLIDADMRHPRVHQALGVENHVGLVQVLSGEVSLEAALQQDDKSGMLVLPAGHGAINPPDLLRSDHMASLLERLRAEFDLVVIDTPPFVPMTDSQIIAKMVDKMVLVVRWGHTPVPVVQNVIKQIYRVGAPLVGSVLSRVDISRQANYGYGDYGYHYSRYGAYYGTKA
ncbi:hypothetical protein CLG96_03170 [Sphingomonas oleivorans]|uniref:non-specific protein-tyrosine kinase n=1 Tax=Sphingomonas oleivorans TaxID=1735121 RepID=A0A2T5G1X1_9SPHN|nr:polysaccharide biosynthesis tyrosine autokinase [Sphingomonas oleivorans]PTQ13146.1 hypothetical protein CLG96_03170 [Sphingomonas oleivorans]